MAMNRPLVLLAGFCFVLHVVSYGAQALPQADTSNLKQAAEEKLQINTLRRLNDNEVRLGERSGCGRFNDHCDWVTVCCNGLSCKHNYPIKKNVCRW